MIALSDQQKTQTFAKNRRFFTSSMFFKNINFARANLNLKWINRENITMEAILA